jgi:N-[(2S)-2-amino-2-carboxyethyl]-L-glutamate dehydrogenase
MMAVEFLYLSQEDVIASGGLDMDGTLATVEEAFRLWGVQDVVQPIKSTIRWGPPGSENTRGRIIAMAAHVGGDVDMAGVKWIPSMPRNPAERGLPRACALIILSDPHTGLPRAVMDGTVISAMRTGAATGVAAKYLARLDASALGLVGAGVQNRTQLLALCRILPRLAEVRVFDLRPERARAFCAEMQGQVRPALRPVDSARAAIEGADIFVTATVSGDAYVEADWIKDGAFHSEISSWDTKLQTLRAYDKIVVDDWQSIRHGAKHVSIRALNEGVIPESRIHGELGEIVAGRKPGRETAAERILFNPIGMPMNDVSEATRVYRAAQAKGVGRVLPLWQTPIWV